MAALNGNDIIIMSNGMAIAGVKSHDIQSSADTVEKASATQQDWKEYIAGRKSWQLSVSYLMMAASDLEHLLSVGKTYTIVVCDRTNSNSVTGTAIMTQCKQQSSTQNLVKGSFQFCGTGELK